jgi:molybdenum cofactor cytidylyltransferase
MHDSNYPSCGGGQIAAIILAAGPSTRMGRPKQLLEFRGETLVERAAVCALESGCRPVVVVTGAHAQEIRKALHALEVSEVQNHQWELGLSSSIRVGVAAVVRAGLGTDAIVLMACDQPFIRPETIAGLIATYRQTRCSIVASNYAGTLGVPALFSRPTFAELETLEGAEGAKQIIRKYGAAVQAFSFPEGNIDIDTPEDFARLN